MKHDEETKRPEKKSKSDKYAGKRAAWEYRDDFIERDRNLAKLANLNKQKMAHNKDKTKKVQLLTEADMNNLNLDGIDQILDN